MQARQACTCHPARAATQPCSHAATTRPPSGAPEPKARGVGREVEVALDLHQVVAVPRPHALGVVQDEHRALPPQHHVQVLDVALCGVALRSACVHACGWVVGEVGLCRVWLCGEATPGGSCSTARPRQE